MVLLPKNWKRCYNKTLLDSFTAVVKKAKEIGIIKESCCPTLFTFSSKKLWGEARKPNPVYPSIQPNIGLNKVFLENPENALKTIVHEVAHLGCGYGHDWRWEEDYKKLGAYFGIKKYSKRDSSLDLGFKEEVSLKRVCYKYAIYCEKCGVRWKYERLCNAVKNPSRYQCTKCKSKLLRDFYFKTEIKDYKA